MKRKLLSVVLAVAMVLTMMPMTALAEESGSIKVGETTYSTLTKAAESINDSSNITITGTYTVTPGDATAIKEKNNIVIIDKGASVTFSTGACNLLQEFSPSLQIQNGGALTFDILNKKYHYFGGDESRMKINQGSVTLSNLNKYTEGGCIWTLSDDADVEVPADAIGSNDACFLQLKDITKGYGITLEIPKSATMTVKGVLRGVAGTDTGQKKYLNHSKLNVNGTLDCSSGLLSLGKEAELNVGTTGTVMIGKHGIGSDSTIDKNNTQTDCKHITIGDGGTIVVKKQSYWTDQKAKAAFKLPNELSGTHDIGNFKNKNGDTVYFAKPKTMNKITANIENQPYATLEDALKEAGEMAQNGQKTIVNLVADEVTTTGNCAIPEGVILEVGENKTLKITEDSFESVLGSTGKLVVQYGGKVTLPENSDGVTEELWIGNTNAKLNLEKDAAAEVDFSGDHLLLTLKGHSTIPTDKKFDLHLNGKVIDVVIDNGAQLDVSSKATLSDSSDNQGENPGSTLTAIGNLKVDVQGTIDLSTQGSLNVNNNLEVHDEGKLVGNVTVNAEGTAVVYGETTEANFILTGSEARVLANGNISEQVVNGTAIINDDERMYTPIDGDVAELFRHGWIYQAPVSSPGSVGSSGSSGYSVQVDQNIEHGHVSVTPKSATVGKKVTVKVTPDEGYVLDELTVTDKDGNEITVNKVDENTFTFTMPKSRVTVSATFVEEKDSDIANKFTDVPAGEYYSDAVAWAVENGVTEGTSETTFSPDLSCSRAEIVTFLWRAAGSPEPENAGNSFTDVNTDAYYGKAVLWAVANDITNGTGGTTFSPDATCTRAQIVTFLYRYEDTPSVSGTSFGDVPSGAYYANAVSWAVDEGVTKGTSETTFSPDNTCTRGQAVTFLYRDLAEK